ncbi:MAG: hypothetical protein ABL931_20760 [Usitatibacteraceae bacterium]
MRTTPLSVGAGSIAYLKSLHGTVMKDRPEVRAGEFKTVNNAADNTIFVHKHLVQGTLFTASKILTSVSEGVRSSAYRQTAARSS